MIVRSCLEKRSTQLCQRRQPILSRPFHSTSSRRDEQGIPNLYETLEIDPNASPAEVKKQFYKLSKAHHPDLHPNDSEASHRFVQISEAYATLGSSDKRARYDRDFHRANQSGPSNMRPGSFSSASTPFGGRPASGLSRRRGQFRGPPPSFYRSGGWGQYSDKRGEHASKASHSHEAQGNAQSGPDGQTAGTGPGGFNSGFNNDVPHFDNRAHQQTQSNIERSRHKARRKDTRFTEVDREATGGGGPLVTFLWISGLLAGIFGLSGVLANRSKDARRQKEEGGSTAISPA